MKRHVTTAIFLWLLLLTTATAQNLHLVGEVEDGYLGRPLTDVRISVLTADSTLVTDSVRFTRFTDRAGNLQKMVFSIAVGAAPTDLLVRASREGYDDAWQRVSTAHPTDDGIITLPTFKMQKRSVTDLGEVVVKATKIKMYNKGDTIVYNADAFKLPDGSMLDALIRQLPGVTMSDDGQIRVNGRLVDELLLQERSFMRGNKNILMKNLPYYTVKTVKAYEKQSDKSQALGSDVEPRRFVMDVNLKDEYSRGYIANMEAAYGTSDRWLARGFLLGYDDLWRYSVMANANNVNETRQMGAQGFWTPGGMPQSVITTRSVATDLDYQSKNKQVTNNLTAFYTDTKDETDMRMSQETFLDGLRPISMTEAANRTTDRRVRAENNFTLKKPFYLRSTTTFEHNWQRSFGISSFVERRGADTTALATRSVSRHRSWSIAQQVVGGFSVNRSKQWNAGYTAYFRHAHSQARPSSRFETWQTPAAERRVSHNAQDISNRTTAFMLSADASFPKALGRMDIRLDEAYQNNYINDHDYLYHPDTLTLVSQIDMLTATADANNSYRSRRLVGRNTVSLHLSRQGHYQLGNSSLMVNYNQWDLGLDLVTHHRTLDYQRGAIDTTLRHTVTYLQPSLSYRHMSSAGKRDLRLNARFAQEPVDLMNQVAYRDDSRPLVTKLGNPALKGSASSHLTVDYTRKGGQLQQLMHVGAAFHYAHRDVAQAVTYDPATGMRTYQPRNTHGAYNAQLNANFSGAIDRDRRLTWQTAADATFHHAVDHALLVGETESRANAVNTLQLHDGAYLQYDRSGLNVRLSGDLRWRNSKGLMRDFATLNAWDYNYGLSARYTLPGLGTTLAADATMYSRRGYGSSSLNTDDVILNASASQPLCKGKLILRIEAFDLLHQLSNTRYEVSAQGRVETWYRSLPHYLMLHLTYHWSKAPRR